MGGHRFLSDVLVAHCDIECNDDDICLRRAATRTAARQRPTERVKIYDNTCAAARPGDDWHETSGGIDIEVKGLTVLSPVTNGSCSRALARAEEPSRTSTLVM